MSDHTRATFVTDDDTHSTSPGTGRHVTPQLTAAIEAYMRDILHRLDLGYWDVHVATDVPDSPDALLAIHPTDGRRVAMLYVSEGWAERDPDPRQSLVHEALHLAHHDQEECIRRFFRENGDIGEYVKSIIQSQFRMETERMVDSLANAISPLMPTWHAPKEDQ